MRQGVIAQRLCRFEPHRGGIPNLLAAGSYRICRAVRVVAPHTHRAGRLEIVHVASGQQTMTINGARIPVHQGHGLVIHPGDLHGDPLVGQEPSTICYLVMDVVPARDTFLNLRGPQARSLQQALLETPGGPFLFSRLAHDLMGALLQALQQRRDRVENMALATLRVHAALISLLLEVARCAARNPRDSGSPLSELVARHLNANPDQIVSVAELARLSKLSVPRFQMRFKAETGLSPIQFVQRHKIEMARSQLRHSKTPVTEVALALGFCSSQHFATVFRQFTGQTPQEFRSGRPISRAKPAP